MKGSCLIFNFYYSFLFWEAKRRLTEDACRAAGTADGVSSPLPSSQRRQNDARPDAPAPTAARGGKGPRGPRCRHPDPPTLPPRKPAGLQEAGREAELQASPGRGGGEPVLACPGLVWHLIWWREQTARPRNGFHKGYCVSPQ